MVWGCFTWWNVGPLVKTESIMKKDVKPGFGIKARHQSKIRKVFLRRLPLMISAFDSIVSCMSSSTTWTLCSVLIFSGCGGTAMSFIWRRMLWLDDTTLYPLEKPNRGSPVIDWCNQLA